MAALPESVAAALCGRASEILEVSENRLQDGTGAATGEVTVLSVLVRAGDGAVVRRQLVRKASRPATGRHAGGARDPGHWAYWRREAEAYRSGVLPTGPGLRAPRCLGVEAEVVYLEAVEGSMPSVPQAAAHLAAWQVPYEAALDRPWLAQDQLGQRLAVTELDWSTVKADPRVVRLWERRHELLGTLRALPLVRSHGDYSVGNLIAVAGDTVALDWATFGWEPVGFDLAHLALSCGEDPTGPYLAAAPTADSDAVRAGFRAAIRLVGTSRVHWMLSRGHDMPAWYFDFLLDS